MENRSLHKIENCNLLFDICRVIFTKLVLDVFSGFERRKKVSGKETIKHQRRKPQNCFYAAHNDISDEADHYYVYMMMVLTMMMTMMIMRMTLMEQRASKLADPQWGSVRRHFDHSITITPQNHNTYLQEHVLHYYDTLLSTPLLSLSKTTIHTQIQMIYFASFLCRRRCTF